MPILQADGLRSFMAAGIKIPLRDRQVLRLMIRYRPFVQWNVRKIHTKKFHQWSRENPLTSLIPLSTHQGMTVEVVDEVVSLFAYQNRVISEDLCCDLTSNFLSNDASIACVCLCTKLANDLFKSSDISQQDNVSIVKKATEETIRSLPKLMNP